MKTIKINEIVKILEEKKDNLNFKNLNNDEILNNLSIKIISNNWLITDLEDYILKYNRGTKYILNNKCGTLEYDADKKRFIKELIEETITDIKITDSEMDEDERDEGFDSIVILEETEIKEIDYKEMEKNAYQSILEQINKEIKDMESDNILYLSRLDRYKKLLLNEKDEEIKEKYNLKYKEYFKKYTNNLNEIYRLKNGE